MSECLGTRGVRRFAVLAAAVSLVLAVSGCGSQVDRAEIARAAGDLGAATVDGQGMGAVPPAGVGVPQAETGGVAIPGNASTGVAATAPGAAAPVTGTGSAGAAVGKGPQPAAGARPGSAPQIADRPEIKLGHIGTYSGVLGAIFKGGREMTQVWASWVNARGGLNGHPVRVITADDGGDPSRNLSLVRSLVEQQKVIAFFGAITPLSLNGSKAYLEQKQIPLVGGDLTDVGWYESPMFFPQGALIDGPLRGTAQLAVKHGGAKVALIYCGEAAACYRARDIYNAGAVTKAGGELVYTAQVSLAQPDFTAECLQLRFRGVQAVVATVDGNSLARIARDCKQQNVKVTFVSFALALVDSLRDSPDLDGLVAAAGAFPWTLNDGPAADYAAALSQYGPRISTSGSTSSVWGSGLLLQAASRALPAGAVTSADLLNGLWALKKETLGGLAPPLTFRKGQPPVEMFCWYRIALNKGVFSAPDGLKYTCT
ncbi:ABC transporter substrate-binding protein [Sporichthya polymorpha]|uniref:ABC transporter substrate-binding protein n=1 Tax=Sporichthya polymorpha TaxID=35751 RepID=UPI0012ECB0D6|nr:ABC transporter substrate-binding protein [Sporichthya polymorpha]